MGQPASTWVSFSPSANSIAHMSEAIDVRLPSIVILKSNLGEYRTVGILGRNHWYGRRIPIE
jgi:hypothetical protein